MALTRAALFRRALGAAVGSALAKYEYVEGIFEEAAPVLYADDVVWSSTTAFDQILQELYVPYIKQVLNQDSILLAIPYDGEEVKEGESVRVSFQSLAR